MLVATAGCRVGGIDLDHVLKMRFEDRGFRRARVRLRFRSHVLHVGEANQLGAFGSDRWVVHDDQIRQRPSASFLDYEEIQGTRRYSSWFVETKDQLWTRPMALIL